MLRRVIDIRKRYARLDSLEWSLANDEAAMPGCAEKIQGRPCAARCCVSLQVRRWRKVAPARTMSFARRGAVSKPAQPAFYRKRVSARLLRIAEGLSLNIDGLLAGFDPLFTEQLKADKAYAAANEQAALLSQIGTADVKSSRSPAVRGVMTSAKRGKNAGKIRQSGNCAVSRRKNYPLNTYLDGRANTTSPTFTGSLHNTTPRSQVSTPAKYQITALLTLAALGKVRLSAFPLSHAINYPRYTRRRAT